MLVLALEYLPIQYLYGIDIKTKAFEFPFVIVHNLFRQIRS